MLAAINPSDDPAGSSMRQPLRLAPSMSAAAELSLSDYSDGGPSRGDSDTKLVTRRVIRSSHRDSDVPAGASGVVTGKTYPWLDTTRTLVVIICAVILTIVVSIFLISLMPAVTNVRYITQTASNRMPQLEAMLDQVQLLVANDTQKILSDTIRAMQSFADAMDSVEDHVSDPKFRENVEAAFTSFVQQDLKSALRNLADLLAALTRFSNAVRTNGMQAQLTIPLAPVETPPPEIASTTTTTTTTP